MDAEERVDKETREEENGETQNNQSFEIADGEPFSQNFEEQKYNLEPPNDVNSSRVARARDEDERGNE
ncbi:hypothetical protein ACJMK2_007209, partial [Sinanodonta woodiana]